MEDKLKDANLRFSTDKKPGFTRKVNGKKFEYLDTEGKKITQKEAIERINKLAIPPAYESVWISPHHNGHLQATGYDSKKRKQYRYHSLWIKVSQEEKFDQLINFAKNLPKIRNRIRADLALPGYSRQKILAVVVWLLENTLIRIGNEEYEKENKSYGLTTLKNRHAEVIKEKITFRFRGKSGVDHKISIRNKRVARIIRRCKEIPGQDLFEYFDENREVQTISSEDVNSYLQEVTKTEITAKDFRTWGGTVLAATAFDKAGVYADENVSKKHIVETVKKVASHLRNKPNTCRKYYIHPHIITAYTNGHTISNFKEAAKAKTYRSIKGLDEWENKVVSILRYMARSQAQVHS